MQFKSAPGDLKVNSKERSFTGYASVFGNRDSHGDIIQAGAFTRTLANDAGRVKVLWQHDAMTPIGMPTSMAEDDRGLRVTARIADTTQGKDALALMDAGVIDELSIGYDAIRDEWDDTRKARMLLEIRLWEFSPVTWASNDLARITSVKHASDLNLILDRLERLEWAHGRLRSDDLRARTTRAIETLTRIRDGDAAPVTPDTPEESAASTAHAALASLAAFHQKLLTTDVLRDLRAFGATIKETRA
jgi:HK97 family phage prohead protease